MKKSIFALVLALVLCVSTCALGEAAFDFTAEQFVEGYSKFNTDVMQKEVIWYDPVEAEGMTCTLGSAEGMNDIVVYNVIGDPACIGMYTECVIGMSDSDMTAKAQALGMTVAAIPFATRYLETGYDVLALQDEISGIETSCQELVQKVFSSDAITAAMSAPYTETAVIGGHNAELTLSMSLADMTMTVSFTYVP